jgi:hypothetical protein
MGDSLNAAIAAGAALLASGLTGALTLRVARHGALAAALQAYGYATDRLRLEIGVGRGLLTTRLGFVSK